MFRVTGTKSTNAGSLEFKDCGIEFIGRTRVNNGVQGYIDELEYVHNEDGTITVSQVGTIVAQYRGNSYYTSQNIAKIKYLRKLSKEEGLYLVTCINKHLQLYGGYQTPKLDDIRNFILELPVLTSEDTAPYWDYMAYYISQIEQKYAEQLEVKSEYELNLMCQILGVKRDDIVQRVEYQQPQYTNTFRVGELFGVTGTKSKNAGSLEFKDCGVEFIGRTRVNNGVQGYIDELEYAPNEDGTITVSQVGTIVAQYRGNSYYTSQNIAKIKYLRKLSKEEGLYLVTCINKHLQLYGGYQTPKLDDIRNFILELPVLAPNSKQIDWDTIRNAIIRDETTIWLLVKRYATEILR